MPAVTSHPPGSFCWVELATTDVVAARAFYTEMFSWEVSELPMGAMEPYYIFRNRQRDAAAMYRVGHGVSPGWLSYVSVTSVDGSVAKAKSLGATVRSEPADVFDAGRFASLTDPEGTAFALWQPRKHIGVGVRDEANALCWNELQARDPQSAKKFYVSLFDWRMKESDNYVEWHLGGNAVAGMPQPAAASVSSPLWLTYFAVDDCDATVEKTTSLGGRELVAPMDIPNIGRFAVLGDPQGAPFAVICLAV